MKRMTGLGAALAIAVAFAALAFADEKVKTATKSAEAPAAHTMFTPSDIKWGEGPPSLPAGAKVAVLEGDPAKEGYFAMRLKAPAGYKIMPHWHPGIERVTVISGTFHIGLGDTFDESKGHAMPAGTYATMRPKTHHFAWSEGETELQITTLGPWKLIYVNPEDDPSRASKAPAAR